MKLYTNCKEKENTTGKVMKEVSEDISFKRLRKEKLWLVNSYLLKVYFTTIEELFIKHWPQNFEEDPDGFNKLTKKVNIERIFFIKRDIPNVIFFIIHTIFFHHFSC